MQTYNIQIDEAQRLRIIAALELLDAQNPVDANESVTAFGVATLRRMFTNLPHDEQESPSCTHGLCY